MFQNDKIRGTILYDYTFYNDSLTRVDSIKNLGTTLDSELIFDEHVENIVKTVSFVRFCVKNVVEIYE